MIYTLTLNPSLDRTLHLPCLRVGELNRATSSRIDLGGKGINVSRALHSLGAPSVLMGFAGGQGGRNLVQSLQAQGYECDFVPVAGEVRANITVIDDNSGLTTKLNEPGPQVTPQDLEALAHRILLRLTLGDVCVLSGSLPPGAPTELYAHWVTLLQTRGAVVVLDAAGPVLAAGCAAGPSLIKPNCDEAAAILGRDLASPTSWADALADLRALGAQRVLLSADRRGAVYACAEGLWWATPPPIHALSAVGAGDALLAGGLWAWQQGLAPGCLVRWAVAAGTAAAQTDGTAMPDRAAIERVYQQVNVQKL